MMKACFTILLLFVISNTFAQTSFLKEAVSKLDKALVKKDTVVLKQLLHGDLTYGHSNGWVENKEEVIKDLYSGKLAYHNIESSDYQWKTGSNWANVRSRAKVAYTMDGKQGELNLHILQVWLKTNKGWQLVARQSTKL
jgi:hypothetical protein